MSTHAARNKLLCIVCPEGCEFVLDKDGEPEFTDRACKRGRDYARQELSDPRRVLTTTVRLRSGEVAMAPVRTAAPIARASLIPAMKSIAGIEVDAPVRAGQVLCPDVGGTGIALIACRSIARVAG